jgi:hypothetical protein
MSRCPALGAVRPIPKLLPFITTFKFFNNLGNLLFARSQPKSAQQAGFCHGFATVSFPRSTETLDHLSAYSEYGFTNRAKTCSRRPTSRRIVSRLRAAPSGSGRDIGDRYATGRERLINELKNSLRPIGVWGPMSGTRAARNPRTGPLRRHRTPRC